MNADRIAREADVAPAPIPGSRITTAVDLERAAWTVYRAHSTTCPECARRLHGCPTGAALWEAYREARGPLLHLPGRPTVTTPKPAAPVGLCQHCDQPVMPGDEELLPVITGGVGQAADILLHKGGCQRRGDEPRRHN